MKKWFRDERGAVHTIPLLLLIVAVGVVSYLLISSTAPFKGGLFNTINPKPASQAASNVGVWQQVAATTGSGLANSVVNDPNRPSDFYAVLNGALVKSTDYGQTWNQITPQSGLSTTNFGALSIKSSVGSGPATLYDSGCCGNMAQGFWRSTDGGLNWTNYTVAPGDLSRQDVYAPAVDPYNTDHLIMARHENDGIAQSFNGGQTWTELNIINGSGTYAPGSTNCPSGQSSGGMCASGGTGWIFFINTGNASTTASTWLWLAQGTGGAVGTWRTSNGGITWTKVDSGEHDHTSGQIYQPDTSGVVYSAQVYSTLGWGVLRSTDYGQTWTHVGLTGNESTTFGTPYNVYSEVSIEGSTPNLESAPQPGINGWVNQTVPSGQTIGAAQVAESFDGSNYIIVTANWEAGIWRYVEPNNGQTPAPTPTQVPTPTPTPQVTPSPTPHPSATPVGGCAKYTMGDIDCNGAINIFDYNTIVTNFGKTEPANTNGDLDGNGIINIFDYNTLLTNFGK